jgi:arachidonate 15-lipoxygenase
MSADLPGPEKFTLDYEAQVLKVFVPMLENFKSVIRMLLERELQGDLPTQALADVRAAWKKFDEEFSPLHPIRDAKDLHALLDALSSLPAALEGLALIPQDIQAIITGLEKMFQEMLATGPTAFLKSTAYDVLNGPRGRAYLHAESIDDYAALFKQMPKPTALSIERQPWMPAEGEPSEQDWFFGYLQLGGFNTTQLRGVVSEADPGSTAITLHSLLQKCPVTDLVLQSVSGDSSLTL